MKQRKIRTVAPAALKPHPASALVPAMRSNEWEQFYTDIAMRGVRVPLEVGGDGTVLDGRHRLRAAVELALPEVPIIDVPLGNDSAEDYVLKAAVLRRHLTDDQRAAMAAMWKREHKRQGERTDLTSEERPSEVSEDHPTESKAIALLNTTRWKLKEATRVLEEDEGLACEVHAGGVKLKEATRRIKRREQSAAVKCTPLPEGQYAVIIVDPPWSYTKRAEDVSHRGRAPYPQMTVEEIIKRPPPAAESCILWLWTTNAFMHEAHHILEAWGFEPKTILTWIKDKMGLGDWLRGQTEHCILAVRGRPTVSLTNQTTALHGKLRQHSRKPEEFYRLVEALCPAPDGGRCEMYAREGRAGWVSWGAEAGAFGDGETKL